MKRTPIRRRSELRADPESVKAWLNKKRKRIRPIGRRGKRMRENGEVFGPLRDLIMDFRELGGHCDSCQKWTDTLRCDHVSKKKPRTAWKDGDGNLWGICLDCDTIKESRGQKFLDDIHPERPTGKAIAKAWGQRFLETQENDGGR